MQRALVRVAPRGSGMGRIYCADPPAGAKEICGIQSSRQTRTSMILVTGGAGFIGSNLMAGLNEAGRSDVVVCDTLGSGAKWRNLQKRQLADLVPPAELAR